MGGICTFYVREQCVSSEASVHNINYTCGKHHNDFGLLDSNIYFHSKGVIIHMKPVKM